MRFIVIAVVMRIVMVVEKVKVWNIVIMIVIAIEVVKLIMIVIVMFHYKPTKTRLFDERGTGLKTPHLIIDYLP